MGKSFIGKYYKLEVRDDDVYLGVVPISIRSIEGYVLFVILL